MARRARCSPYNTRLFLKSTVSGLLTAQYSVLEGQPDSVDSFALCYRCHDRDVVLDGDQFPLHRLHVVDEGASCSTCHDPHGVTSARALIRYGEIEPPLPVSPSSSGQLGFLSQSAGSGTCYLSCHGKNHDPLGYGPSFDTAGQRVLQSPERAGLTEAPPSPGAGTRLPVPPPTNRPVQRPQRREPPG